VYSFFFLKIFTVDVALVKPLFSSSSKQALINSYSNKRLNSEKEVEHVHNPHTNLHIFKVALFKKG